MRGRSRRSHDLCDDLLRGIDAESGDLGEALHRVVVGREQVSRHRQDASWTIRMCGTEVVPDFAVVIRTSLHSHSLAASPARSVPVARPLRSLARWAGAQLPRPVILKFSHVGRAVP
jgi:hypothetical protein